MRKYHPNFYFCSTEDEAKALCEKIRGWSSAYCRRKYPPHYTPWDSTDGKEHRFIVWFHM